MRESRILDSFGSSKKDVPFLIQFSIINELISQHKGFNWIIEATCKQLSDDDKLLSNVFAFKVAWGEADFLKTAREIKFGKNDRKLCIMYYSMAMGKDLTGIEQSKYAIEIQMRVIDPSDLQSLHKCYSNIVTTVRSVLADINGYFYGDDDLHDKKK